MCDRLELRRIAHASLPSPNGARHMPGEGANMTLRVRRLACAHAARLMSASYYRGRLYSRSSPGSSVYVWKSWQSCANKRRSWESLPGGVSLIASMT